LDAAGTVVWDGRMEPFGRVDDSGSTVEQPLRFPGRYEDAALRPVYNGARYLVPSGDSYLAPDPASLRPGRGASIGYSYAGSNPLARIDASGCIITEVRGCDSTVERALWDAQLALVIQATRKADDVCGCPAVGDALAATGDPNREITVTCQDGPVHNPENRDACGSTDCADPTNMSIRLNQQYWRDVEHKFPDYVVCCFIHELLHAGNCALSEEQTRARTPCVTRIVSEGWFDGRALERGTASDWSNFATGCTGW
jgi:RHS repeat-associated protein